MAQLDWDWQFFLIALLTLIVMLFLREYKEHKAIDFAYFKSYSRAFLAFNGLYILLGAAITTLLGTLLNTTNLLNAIIYAGSWEGIFGDLIDRKSEKANAPNTIKGGTEVQK